MFPILNWNRWRGYCCPQSENIFRRRRDEKIMLNGKRTRLKKPHYNLIKNLNVKTVPPMTTEPCFPYNAEARQKVCRTFIKRQRQAGFSPVCLFFNRIYPLKDSNSSIKQNRPNVFLKKKKFNLLRLGADSRDRTCTENPKDPKSFASASSAISA